ncbi:MAG: hypothetical protein ACOYK1_07075 [Vampirovibrionia bacterium]
MSSIDTGLRDRVESNVSTAAKSVDESGFAHEISSATRAGAQRSINVKEAAKAGAQATIENPPMKTVTESSKKGSSSRQVVDENALSAAKAQLATLEVEIASLQTDKDTAKSDEDAALRTKETSKSELDENISLLSTFNEADKLLTKFTNAFNGTDGFANKGEEDAALKRLTDYTDKIKEWGDKNGVNDGQHFADAVNGFLRGEGGYLSEDRKYESDYKADGEVAPWKQFATTNRTTDSSGTGLGGDTSSSDLYNRVFGG